MEIHLLQKFEVETHKLTVQQASICISEPPDSPISSYEPVYPSTVHISASTPSPPPPPISIQADSPTSPKSVSEENNERENLLQSHHPATIAEEQDENAINKSSLSLPVDKSTPTSPLSVNLNSNSSSTGNHVVKVSLPERSQSDRRKLSVSNIMNFGERRRSTSSIFSDMRKMSITNFDNLKSPNVGEIIIFFSFFAFIRFFIFSVNKISNLNSISKSFLSPLNQTFCLCHNPFNTVKF
jgi:hypothetical protein